MNTKMIEQIKNETGFSEFQIRTVFDSYFGIVIKSLKEEGSCDTGRLMFALDVKGFVKIKGKGII